MAKYFITSGTSWPGVLTDGSNITVECIGGGGQGAGGSNANGSGGGGGEYRSSVVSYISGTSVTGIQIGVGGTTGTNNTVGTAGTETHWNTNVVIAKGGSGGPRTGGVGGAGGTGGTGTTNNNGGAGGGGTLNNFFGGSGGGGAGSPSGVGGAGGAASTAANRGGAGGGGNGGGSVGNVTVTSTGADGGNNIGGTGHGVGSGSGVGGSGSNGGGGGGGFGQAVNPFAGGVGGAGTEFDSTHGSGGGGGGGAHGATSGTTNAGGNGALYGAGGGGGGFTSSGGGAGGRGANGIIIITYTPFVGTTFLEPGGDASLGGSTLSTGGFWNSSSASLFASDIVHGSHLNAIKITNTFCLTPEGALGTTGRFSAYYYFNALPGVKNPFVLLESTSAFAGLAFEITSGGVFQFWDYWNGIQLGGNGQTLLPKQWYRICIAYSITSNTINEFRVFIDGALSISVTNATLTTMHLPLTNFFIDNDNADASFDLRVSDIYSDTQSLLTDPGDVWVTAKRPFSNGTTNGFTTQIGAGGSGYGSGHAPQVNERPLSATNGWSMIGVGVAITEEYSIEGLGIGDFNISGRALLDYMGWVYASAALSETGSIIVNNASSNIALTSTNTTFTKIAGSTVYPAGGTDIGIVTSTTVTTVSLYECGIVFAFLIPRNNLTLLGVG